MQKHKQVKKTQKPQKSTPIDWLDYINDENLRLAIPVGPRFQADVLEWRGTPHKKYPHCDVSESDTSRWLGTAVWTIRDRSPEIEGDVVGKGRPESCNCSFPGSVQCVDRHVTDKRIRLKIDLGPAFRKWKFDEMGEVVSKLWNQVDQKKFATLVKTNPMSQGKSFMEPALECFSSRCRKSIVSYYFNVYLPRRMALQTRSGCTVVDTDDEEEDKASRSKVSRKRFQVDDVTLYSSRIVKARYLTGRSLQTKIGRGFQQLGSSKPRTTWDKDFLRHFLQYTSFCEL